MNSYILNSNFTNVGNATFNEGKTYVAKIRFKDKSFYTHAEESAERVKIVIDNPVACWDKKVNLYAELPAGNDRAAESVIAFLYNRSEELRQQINFLNSEFIFAHPKGEVCDFNYPRVGGWFEKKGAGGEGLWMMVVTSDEPISMNDGEIIVYNGNVKYSVSHTDERNDDEPIITETKYDTYDEALKAFETKYKELSDEYSED